MAPDLFGPTNTIQPLMSIAPAIIAGLISGLFGLGGSAISAAAGNPNQKESFAKNSATSPITLLRNALNGTNGLGQALQERASQPTKMRSSYYQAPPGFAQDPAMKDPSLLESPGLNFNGAQLFGKPVAPESAVPRRAGSTAVRRG